MIAVDTNVLIRLLTGDEPKQAAAARSIFSGGSIWIAKTVMLEADWVLRRLYGFEESAIRDAFTKLMGLPNVQTEDGPSVATALMLTVHGIEFADALHFSSRHSDATFVSFDQTFVLRARRAGAIAISGIPIKQL